MEGVLAVVTNFAANFEPKYWAYCNGQILPINANQALFSLLGTTYGGNGTTTFALPDLRGRTVVSAGPGPGPGLSPYSLGQRAGGETVTLTTNNLTAHAHSGTIVMNLQANSDDGIDPAANAGYPSRFTGAYSPTANGTMLNPTYNVVIGSAGGSQPMPVLSPFLGMNYIICTQGLYPSRN